MIQRKWLRVTLIIANFSLLIPFFLIQHLRGYTDFSPSYPGFGDYIWLRIQFVLLSVFFFFNFFNIGINYYYNKKERQNREALEKQKKEEEVKKRQEELILRIEKEKIVHKEKKLEMINNYELAGRFEDAAKLCDELEMWNKAGELRRMAKTSYQISTKFNMGKDGAISCACPTCGSSQVVKSKSNLVTCQHCGNNYIIPKKIFDMM